MFHPPSGRVWWVGPETAGVMGRSEGCLVGWAQDLMIKGSCEVNGPITNDDQSVTYAIEEMVMSMLLMSHAAGE